MDENIKNKITTLKLGKKTTLKHNGIKLSIYKGSNNLFVRAKQPWFIIITSIIVFFFIVQILAYFISFNRVLDDGTSMIFSGQGFIIEMANKYPFVFFAFFIITPILLSRFLYNYIQINKV